MPTEGKTSVGSKIVLKCWLDDKIKANDIESRVDLKKCVDKNGDFTGSSISNNIS